MVESIEKLRKICSKNDEVFYMKFFARKISIYLTRIMIKLNITANKVTIMGSILLLNGIFLLSLGKHIHSIIGAIFIHLWMIFDGVDGEVARYNNYKNLRSKSSNIIGERLESVQHILFSLIFLSISINTYKNLESPIILILGLLGFISWVLYHITTYIKYPDTDIIKLNNLNNLHIFKRVLLKVYSNYVIKNILYNFFTASTISCFILLFSIIDLLYIVIIIYGMLLPICLIISLYFRLRIKFN